jgi:hypothetical protein
MKVLNFRIVSGILATINGVEVQIGSGNFATTMTRKLAAYGRSY